MELTLLNDILFKVVFGTQRNAEALRGLLNAILGLEGADRIDEVTLLNPLREKERLTDKGTALDVKAKDGRGSLYNIEVQVQAQAAYRERSLFYAANLISSQVEAGEDYRRLRKTIHISLTDFVLFPDIEDLHSTYVLYDREHKCVLGDLLELHYFEMAKFRKDDHEELADSLDRWFYFMRTVEQYDDVSDMPESLQQEEGMAIAMRAAHNALSDGEVREAIEARRKWERDRITEMNIAVEEGEARGEARGRAEGKAEGKAEGETAATLAIARSLLASGQSAELIFQVTGLRIDELE